MSSTNRGYERHKRDYYRTPKKHIKLFLNHFTKDINKNKFNQILVPGSGGDENHEMSYPNSLSESKQIRYENIVTLDIREDSPAQHTLDYLETNKFHKESFDLVITNPPFRHARKFIKKSLRLINKDGFVVMLLRLNFFGSQKRKPFWDEHMAKRCYVHHERISFTEDGGTDSIEYMHCVWQKTKNLKTCKLQVI